MYKKRPTAKDKKNMKTGWYVIGVLALLWLILSWTEREGINLPIPEPIKRPLKAFLKVAIAIGLLFMALFFATFLAPLYAVLLVAISAFAIYQIFIKPIYIPNMGGNTEEVQQLLNSGNRPSVLKTQVVNVNNAVATRLSQDNLTNAQIV